MNFTVPIPLYSANLMVSVDESDEQLNRALKKYDLKLSEACSFKTEFNDEAYFISYTSGNGIIRIKNIPETAQEHGILAHEIFHAVCFVMKRSGIKLCNKSDEAFSHFLGYITEEIYKKFYDFKK